MLGSVIGNASIIELFWVLNCFIGISFSIRNWREALTDLQLVEKLTNGRRTIAVGTLITETLILSKFTLFAILGIMAVSLPGNGGEGSLIGLIFALMLFATSLMLTGISAVNRHTSQYLLKYGMQSRDNVGRFIKESKEDDRR